MAAWGLLDEKSESDLHKTRLLNVEEKPFRRISKRVGSISSLIPKTPDVRSPHQNGAQHVQKSGVEQLKEDFTFDFAAFDSSIARLQFLLHANSRERERYQEDQQRIMAECQAVRNNNTQLREQLEEAKATLAQRKKFDELAEKITSNRLLRPREEQVVNLAKLEEECKDLERESQTYSETWNERRNQFNRIMEEGMQLRRQIRDEKEEVDRREGMNEGGDDDDEADKGGRTPRHEPSRTSTPHPDGESQSKVNGDGATPGPGDVPPTAAQDFARSQLDTTVGSRDVTPAPANDEAKEEPAGDVDMEENGQPTQIGEEGGATPQIQVDAANDGEDKMEVDN